VELTERARQDRVAPRLRESVDPVHGLHILTVELPPDRAAPTLASERAATALARVSPRRTRGCALQFDRALRVELDRLADPARLPAPPDGDRAAFVSAALERLGAAEADAVAVPALLALLRAAVEEVEAPADRHAALQTLVAPDLSATAFGAALDRAETSESACARGVR
jgi:hypothetical protein